MGGDSVFFFTSCAGERAESASKNRAIHKIFIVVILSEDQLQPELHLARVSRAGDASERGVAVQAVRARAERRVRKSEVDVVRRVERFGAELQLQLFGDREVLED